MNGCIDDFTLRHLSDWLSNHVADCEREGTTSKMINYLAKHEDVIARGYSWRQIRDLAEVWQ